MAQVTLYMDDDVLAMLDEAARASGLSRSRWMAELVRNHVSRQWPADALAQLGRFPDFPLQEDIRGEQPQDVERMGF